MSIRYANFRLDASSLQELPDGGIRVIGQLTHPGIFSYRNPNGTERKEYRPAEEVFRADAMKTFAASTITINHPRTVDGQRLVTPESWRNVAIGHVGENVREDAGHMVADLYIREADAVKRVKSGDLKHISCGYEVAYDPTPGITPQGERYDGVQRNIRGNHVALLPTGIAPRGGSNCVLRLDSAGDELNSDVDPKEIEALQAKVVALEGELAKARTDNAELTTQLTAAKAATPAPTEVEPARLDALVAERAKVLEVAKASGVDKTDGLATVALKRAIVAKRTPKLAERVDSMGNDALDALLAVYEDGPHPSMGSAVSVVTAPVTERTDSANKIPNVSDLRDKMIKDRDEAWKNAKGAVS